ncbi:ABC transporter substrate-binding protein [Bradyrhizobium sp. Pear77]|uniref:ABC transporter substrate-binding protein n=1 Tax=Bradyrhizobium altum TaxID=1571202 RepID=UPI0035DE534E|nr:ABC transporter substrate-binding protein [Bradyrhizobium altum]
MAPARYLTASVMVLVGLIANVVKAEEKHFPGVTKDEIKIGNIMPYSGPASSWGVIGEAEAAYFEKINAEGGIHGRKIKFISYDDGYSPPKTVEQARRLVEDDEVLLIFSSLGTATNGAIQRYMNTRKVPLLFVVSGATRFNDPANSPWVMPILPSYEGEGRIYARYLLQNQRSSKIAILYQNDDFGKDVVKGFKDGLNGKIPIVAEKSFDISDTTVDSQIVALKSSGADVLLNIASPKFAAQTIRKVNEIGWKPVYLLNSSASSIGGVLQPAGLENSIGILSAAYMKDQTDPIWHNDADYREWLAFVQGFYPDGDRANVSTVSAQIFAQTLVHVLQQCGDDLSRENVMRQATNLRNLQLGMLLPGITINTEPGDFAALNQMRMRRFTGQHWQPFGPVISGAAGKS